VLYLDNNATTMIAPEVREAMVPYLAEHYANPSSVYSSASRVRRQLEEGRAQIAELLGAWEAREIVFTSGGTESNNAAIRSALKSFPKKKKIVTSEVEHPSIRSLSSMLKQEGCEVVTIGVSKTGAIDLAELEASLTDDVAVVSVMWANNETGVVFPIAEIANKVKARGILFHVDAVQAVGKLPIKVSEHPIDFLSMGAHKFHGPKGIGALYVRKGTPFHPLIVGGRQERDRRAGTENVAGIVGMTAAFALTRDTTNGVGKEIELLRDRLESRLLQEVSDSFANGAKELRLPNTTNITIPGIESEAFLIRLSELGVAASSGSACLTGAIEPSHVLQSMGISRKLSLSSIRLSLSRYTRLEDVDFAVGLIPELVTKMRHVNDAKT
jgi:cysteine desulfurase